MANKLTANPWYLDTTGTITTNQVKVKQFELVGYTADTDVAILKRNDGTIIAQLNGASDLSTARTGPVGWVEGIKLDTLTLAAGGAVLVYFD